MDDLQSRMWDFLTQELDAEEVARAFTNYWGNNILNEDFAEFLADEYGFDYEEDE